MPKKLTQKEFINRSKLIHDNKYDYSELIYNNNRTKVKIKCPDHGFFDQVPSSHLTGKGCDDCARLLGVWHYSAWERCGQTSKNFSGFKFYIVKLFNDDDCIFKFGKTYLNIKYRLREIKEYDYQEVITMEGSDKEISLIEEKFSRLVSKDKSLPLYDFDGRTECFTCPDISYYTNKLNQL